MPTLLRPFRTDTAIAGQPFVPALPTPTPPVSGAQPGPPGLSAYQLWLVAGNTGTEAQFLASLGGTPPKYRHDQTVAATTWTVNHALGFIPQIEVYNAGSQRLPLAAVSNPNVNQSIITFNAATSGFALCQ